MENALVFPGWFVRTENLGAAYVLNPKGVRSLVTKYRPAKSIEEGQLRRIVYQLSRLCVVKDDEADGAQKKKARRG
ncbi:MAG: hypothetical protein E1N59_2819 [Puniceicoccaceae bacterium 5H]|nr:MAG: hypothetical protein E1N59_2819 [Puniceicoccaceae bacterium 5H]